MDSPIALLTPEQPVLHAGRRATFLHMSGGVAIIRHCGDSHAVAVPPETLSLVTPRRVPLAAQDEPLTRESRP
ncbi:MAG TPA: hypothetical protein VFV91_13470 [Gaiellaceae bacterium]|jgi:hypothetical protein|nr:hypothetical protein [Gaiellaceae bacterium]